MTKRNIKTIFTTSACAAALLSVAHATEFNVASGDLESALNQYTAQSGVPLAVSYDAIKSVKTKGVAGNLSPDDALSRILRGTGLMGRRDPAGVIQIVPGYSSSSNVSDVTPLQMAQAAPARAAVETVTVTSSKLGGADVQSIPIAITALSQEQLTSRQVSGGPDLVKEVPNLTFSKTNFTGYNIQIRGIGTQAISVTTDPAVAVAFNDMPFLRNHFFEQEFYDVSQAEVLRGPQGTLYGRNATAGVVNIVSAKPTDQFEASASADIGNYKNRRFEGMINLPIIDDRLDIRAAAEWTKRDGYSFNQITNTPIDGRNLWSSRLTIGLKPTENLHAYLVWEHFQENDDRLRSSKQLCETDTGPASVNGVHVPTVADTPQGATYDGLFGFATDLSQGCRATSLYAPTAFQVPDGLSLPYIKAGKLGGALNESLDPYASTTQSTDLRVIESTVNPQYKAHNDVVELNAEYEFTPSLTFTSQTGYNQDNLSSVEDYNRFNTSPGMFLCNGAPCGVLSGYTGVISPDGVFCDPQVGCADRIVAVDRSDETSWQLNQEFRLTSNFSGPLNFSFGGNYLHYETEENYYVFINSLTLYTLSSTLIPYGTPYVPGVTDNSLCLYAYSYGFVPIDPGANHISNASQNQCNYIDPNPISNLDNAGHNYFLSQNPYRLNSYAGFGEVYYNVTPDVKLTGGLRWTDDQKHFVNIPSELLTDGYGYFVTGSIDQEWKQFTGRAAVNWTPKLDFTDQTLVYGSFAHGYKAGGANPPGAVLLQNVIGNTILPIHPLTFKPEFINAYELGTKNTLLDGGLTVNATAFFYDYKNYQISRIVDRTAINDNFNATVRGAEVEAMWEPVPGLRLNFSGGYEGTRVGDGQSSIDLMDRTAGHSDWLVVRPFPTQASNCILPAYVVAAFMQNSYGDAGEVGFATACGLSYSGLGGSVGYDNVVYDPLTKLPYIHDPTVTAVTYQGGGSPPYIPPGYPGFDPAAGTPGDPYTGQNISGGHDYGPAPNQGEGFSKDLGGNELPNAPHFTTSFSADYTMPVSADWAATVHTDFYWQAESWARIFNDNPYDKLHGYTNVNLALILTSQSGWQVMGYLKNAFNTTAITGDFLNSDDTGLTTNVFLTDPRLFGVRITKNW